jgi:hypothetical protein
MFKSTIAILQSEIRLRQQLINDPTGVCTEYTKAVAKTCADELEQAVVALQNMSSGGERTTNTVSNAIALLGECITNGDQGANTLYAWFCGERTTITQVIVDGNSIRC